MSKITKIYVLDTESCGFLGDTVLIQYLEYPQGNIILHDIFKHPPQDTLRLIEEIMDGFLVGFNLTFDMFHLVQTYNYLLSYGSAPRIDLKRYYQIVDEFDYSKAVCLRPRKCLDLLLLGRESIFQAQMNQKPIYIRKVPSDIASELIQEYLCKFELPPLFFAGKPEKSMEWEIIPIDIEGNQILKNIEKDDEDEENEDSGLEIDPDFVDLRLRFFPATSLKSIAKYILGHEDILLYESYINYEEFGNNPRAGNYREHISEELLKWENPRERQYASDDVFYTSELLDYFVKELECSSAFDLLSRGTGTTNHELSVLVANTYFSGFTLDQNKVNETLVKSIPLSESNKTVLNYNSPKQCKDYLHEVSDDFTKCLIMNTSNEILEELINHPNDYPKELVERANFIRSSRKLDKVIQTLERFQGGNGRLHVSFKVLGTKSNRMAGGTLGSRKNIKKNINPQGIGKGILREVVTFTDKDFVLEGGDFSGFEVSIMEAVYNDPQLREDLTKGLKFHALWGMELYGLSYEEMLHKDNEEIYARAKQSVFAEAYGADIKKLSEVTGLTEEEVVRAKTSFQKKYTGIGDAKKKIKEDFVCIKDFRWVEPVPYVETLLGFCRYFVAEWNICRQIYDSIEYIEEDKSLSNLKTVTRRGKEQTIRSATKSALLGAIHSIQNAVQRASGNHQIQSIGGEICKRLMERFWEIQPRGIHPYEIKIMNVHDELQCSIRIGNEDRVRAIRDSFLKEYASLIPLIKMDWKTGTNWGQTH